jgi:hypothetical protein
MVSAFGEVVIGDGGMKDGGGMGDGGWGMGKGERKRNEKGVLRSPLSFFCSSNDGGWGRGGGRCSPNLQVFEKLGGLTLLLLPSAFCLLPFAFTSAFTNTPVA